MRQPLIACQFIHAEEFTARDEMRNISHVGFSQVLQIEKMSAFCSTCFSFGNYLTRIKIRVTEFKNFEKTTNSGKYRRQAKSDSRSALLEKLFESDEPNGSDVLCVILTL